MKTNYEKKFSIPCNIVKVTNISELFSECKSDYVQIFEKVIVMHVHALTSNTIVTLP